MISLLLFSCAAKLVNVGMVDIAEEEVCVVQLVDGSFVELESRLCASLREGDLIKVVRHVK
tara:strand:- start:217 stop:399 length:183 start_codon:yes stop_codon:yes gene_type:complete